MQTQRVLLVVTSADRIGPANAPTGVWLEEIAAPYYTFRDAKCEVTLASPQGGKSPLDPTGLEVGHQTASTRRFDADSKAQLLLSNTLRLETLTLDHYDAVFFAGGHGTMVDFPVDESVKATVEAFYRSGRPVASVCHGPACLVGATTRTGEPVVQGHRFTCFSDAEEHAINGEHTVPFLLESQLIELGGIAQQMPNFQPNVVADRQLITGQNPASSVATAEAVIYQLRQRKLHEAA